MDRLIATNSVDVAGADTAPVTGVPQYATSGDSVAGVPATIWPAYQYNAIQEELLAVIVAAGETPDRANLAQLLGAIRNLITGTHADNTNYGTGRIASNAEAAAGTDDAKWLTPDDLSAVFCGAIQGFFATAAPAGWLECDGSAVSRTTYARLNAKASALSYGNGYGPGDGTTTFNVPDLRGYFLRGWAHGGSIDSGRALGSTQADALKSHTHTFPVKSSDATDAFAADGSGATSGNGTTDATGGTETRPVNVALMYCVKI